MCAQVLPPAVHDTSIDEAAQLAAERGSLHARQTCLDCFQGGPAAEELVLAVDQGAIVNWDAYEMLCHYIFYQQVIVHTQIHDIMHMSICYSWAGSSATRVASSSPSPSSPTRYVGVGVPARSTSAQLQRERIAQTMFETFNTAGLVFCDEPTLSLYAVGKHTGTVIDVGHTKIGTTWTATSVSCVSCVSW